MKVLIVDTIHDSLTEQLTEAGWLCVLLEPRSVSESNVQEALAAGGYDGLVLRSGIQVTPAVIDANPKLKFIGRVGAGLEHIDVQYAKEKGVKVFSSPEGNRQAVAEHALGMLLSLMNHIHTADREVRNGLWVRKQNEGEELEGKTVGIIGHGNTGSAFGRLMRGFELRAVAYDKYKKGYGTSMIEEVSLEQLADVADVVSVHVPYNTETHHMIDHAWIKRFRKPFYLINTSRGGVVSTPDLLNALDEGKVKGACLDVLEYETTTLKMPALESLPQDAERLLNHPRVLLTPHIAGLTVESYRKLSSMLAEKLLEHFKPA